MKQAHIVMLFGLFLFLSGCERERIRPNVAKLSVDYIWEGLKPCCWGNPQIQFSGVPEKAKIIIISMYDHAYSHDHGTVTIPYSGEKVIRQDRFNEIQGPCPVYTPGRYEITIKAMDDRETIIAAGSKVRFFPEE